MSENHSNELVFVFLQETKNYKETKACLGPIFDEIDNLQVNGAEVDGVHYSVIW